MTISEIAKDVSTNAHPSTFFWVKTNSEGVHGFEWDHFIRTQLITHGPGSDSNGQTLRVVMSDCKITINGHQLEDVQIEFMKHRIFYASAASVRGSTGPRIDNISVNGEQKK